MGTFNFKSTHNTPYKAVFCLWEDHDKYLEDCKKENEQGIEDYNDWQDEEKDYYLGLLADDLKEAFGYDVDVDAETTQVAVIHSTFSFAGSEFYFKVSIDMEYGYYCGWALDWNVIEMLDYYNTELPSEEDAYWMLRDNVNDGLAKALASKFIKRCEKALASVTDKLDTILMNLAPHNQSIGWCCGEHKNQAA